MSFMLNWQGAVVTLGLIAGCVACAIFHQPELAMVLGGAAVGHVLPGPVSMQPVDGVK